MAFPAFDFAQLIGMLSFVLGILCFYQKDDNKLKFVMVLMYINHAIHFALLGAIVASLTALLSVLRTWLSLKTSSPLIAYIFIGLSFVMGSLFYTNYVDILPIIGASIGTYALFCMHGIYMRLAFAFGGVCWLLHNLLVGSIGTSLLEAVIFVVNLITIVRLYKDDSQLGK